jgi:hypothetical protein
VKNEEQGEQVSHFVIGSATTTAAVTPQKDLVLRSSDVDQAIDQILLGILKELPYYSPIHRAIRKPLIELLKKAGVGDPGGDGPGKKDDPESSHP